uniref:Ep23 n=1 Tax=Lymantria dispar multicapsid nuclear polyhedrosis virus TaxID=10449 RepID=A0A6H0F1J9_NPVLD|nr:ep23 [Lymantria dispar multiple nucleopolyhedrovirus]
MNINLYYPRNRLDKILTISVPASTNSINLFVFNYRDDLSSSVNDNVDTRLVSGFETSRRQVDMLVRTVSTVPRGVFNAYVVSCVRLPFVAAGLLTHYSFNASLGLAVVQNETEAQVWHVMSARKGFEPASIGRVTGVSVTLDDDADRYYPKELICLQGNIPAELIKRIDANLPDKNVLQVVTFLYPHVKINHGNVTVHYDRPARRIVY